MSKDTSVAVRELATLPSFASYKMKFICLLIFTILFTFGAQLLFSQAPASKQPFGRSETINIYPADIQSSNWMYIGNAVSQDLTEDAIFQDFDEDNSARVPHGPGELDAYLDALEEERRLQAEAAEQAALLSGVGAVSVDSSSTPAIENAVTVGTNTAASSSAQFVAPSVMQQQTQFDEVDVVPVTQPTTTSFIGSTGNLISSVFKRATGLFSFTQQSTTTPVATSIVPAATTTPVLFSSTSVDQLLVGAAPEPAPASSSPEVVPVSSSSQAAAIDENLSSTTGDSVLIASSTDLIPSTPDVNVPVIDTAPLDQNAGTSTANQVPKPAPTHVSVFGTSTHEIVLEDFSVPKLNPGQFVVSSQLRLSFAAKVRKFASTTVQTVEVLFGTDGALDSVGTILIDGETSNALNGGYYLFALPINESPELLNNAKVVLRYTGDVSSVQGMYLDAAWVEIDTKTISQQDLLNRGKADQLKRLEKPKFHDLISEELNFKRGESPVFNLKYQSQRNVVVRGVRSMLGRNLAEVSQVEFIHRSLGPSGIKLDVVVTSSGLISISIPEDQRDRLRPGEYTVSITTAEGSQITEDTFNFQWGILSVNPDKTEYEVGEESFLSIGALTPNGHTICKADLELYVTRPDAMVEKVAVTESGLCDGNNVIDVPDFSALYPVTQPGTYTLYLERLDTDGTILGFTTDTFTAVVDQDISIQRYGPSRIYPPATYPMELTVGSESGFSGTLVERVPLGFKVGATSATVQEVGEWQELTWDIYVPAGGARTVSYSFDAPDISPYLFTVGPAELVAAKKSTTPSPMASTSSSSSPVVGQQSFVEHRAWQIASDAVGKMIILWEDATLPGSPGDWVCLSCGSGDFYQRFFMGSSTYNSSDGNANHTHTVTSQLLPNLTATIEGGGTGGPAINTHSHTITPTIGSASNTPEYRTLQVIRYDVSAGEPATIPSGAILIFDVASSSLPANFVRYAAQDDRYVFGENATGTLDGSNEHDHTIDTTIGASTGGTARSRGTPTQTTGAANNHAHTLSTTTNTRSNEPPYITVVLGKATADTLTTALNGIIVMWDADVDDGWIDLSSDTSSPFSNRFIKASTTYGVTGGGLTHAPGDQSELTSVPTITTTGKTDPSPTGSDPNHQHTVNFTSYSDENHLPPYLTVVFGKRQGTDPLYTQASYQWFVNSVSQLTPTDAWDDDTIDLVEGEPITATSTPLIFGDEVRLRINASIGNATSTAGSRFKLQYAAAVTCSAASNWVTVGDTSSTTVWRGYNNSGVTDHATLGTLKLASSTVAATYEENGYATGTPNDISVDDYGEWDFVLQHNGALAGTNYCFRMVEEDGSVFFLYDSYPQLYTNEAPTAPTLEKLFDNEKTASDTPYFQFSATDPDSALVEYQIQISTDYTFAATDIDENTIDDENDLFSDLTSPGAKPAFASGNLIQFVPNSALSETTYYWRVRANDPDDSAAWGDWSEIRSFTIDSALEATAWFQTENEQFDTNTLVGVESSSDSISFISGSTTGTTTSGLIDFDDADKGTAWSSFAFNSSGDITYFIEYFDGSSWARIPANDLANNDTGHTGSPVSLLNLDTDTYNDLRVVAVFNNASTPSLNDWTINWGYRVETPTITKTFPNEKVGTTSPTFEFSASDPNGEKLIYQVQFSQQYDFTASTTYISSSSAGFENTENGGESSPFTSGELIRFVPPSPLTGATTTWWFRVRAKDATTTGAYSFWTDPQSFTITEGTEVSTWFQTTESQFDTNSLSGTRANAISGGAVAVATTASEAMVVYGEGTDSIPKYRVWDGDEWSDQGEMQDVGSPIRWAVVKAGTTREEYVAATVVTVNDVVVQVYANGEWSNELVLTTTMGDITARGVDVAYETTSGDAMVVYCDNGPDPSYYIWDGTGWNASGTISVATVNNCEWVQLASDPALSSDEIIVLTRDTTGSQYEAQVWNGATWANQTTQGSIVDDAHEGMAVEYEETGGQALIVTSDGNPARIRWDSWNGGGWAGANVETIGDDFEWGKLARDVGSDEMILCYQDEDTDMGVLRWSNTAWVGGFNELTTTANAKNDPGFGCVFEDTAARDNYILTVYSDTTTVSSSSWDNTAWSTGQQINTISNSATMDIVRTGNANILATFYNHPTDSLLFSAWDGSSWSATQILENNMPVGSTPYGQPYDLEPRNSGREGTTIVSPALDFDEGNGPYWQEFRWTDTQPNNSEILYHLQFQTSTGSWAFIPDEDLPGNEAGTTTGPYDLRDLNTTTYNVIRPYAELSCDVSFNCPSLFDWTITWAGGLTISGTLQDYAQSTNVDGGNVEVAVNGVLQTGKTGTINNGNWSISNVTTFPGDVITVFVSTSSPSAQAIGVTRYDGTGDIEGMQLFEKHLSLGSNDATTTPLTNADIGGYDSAQEPLKIFFSASSTALDVCDSGGCGDARLYIGASTTFTPGGTVATHDLHNDGTFVPGANTIYVSGSWDNNATTTMTNSTVVFTATSSVESIDSTGAITSSFNNLTFGTTTGNATWTLASVLDINGDLTVSRGTLARASTSIMLAGDLVTSANGFWTGVGTTTFDSSGTSNWSDQNSTLQNVGNVVVDGTSRTVLLSGNVVAQSITIGANDTLDASASNYDITVYSNWTNNNTFLARSGEVIFAATTTGRQIDVGGDEFYDLTFNGVDGAWSFVETTLSIGNDFTIATGTVTLPMGTTTVAGSFDATGGQFAHGNGTLYFTSAGTETIFFDGSGFINPANNITFNGGGSWTLSDTHATATGDVRILQGAVTFPSGIFAIEGSLTDEGGSFAGNGGTVRFYSSASETLEAGGSGFASIVFDGTGDWTFADTNVTATGDLTIEQGTLVLPSGTFTLGGSYANNDTVTAGTGEVLFNSNDAGETIDFGSTPLYDVTINSVGGGWTIVANATTTNDFALATSSGFTLNSGLILAVGGEFTNGVGGASTTWTGSTLSLLSGAYTINNKADAGDAYDTLAIAANTDIAMWNSKATTTVVDATGSLYSQDHNGVDGDLYIFGEYTRTSGTEYWTYDTDFDGTDLSGSERQVDVRLASGATVSIINSTTSITGSAAASTTIANQGSGTYVVTITSGTTTAQFYEFTDLGAAGVSLLGSTVVSSLANGSFVPAVAGGAGLTLSSTTIDTNPAKQIYNVRFATTSAISAFNVAQTDGTPASFWWFRNGTGNLYGEDFDNDTGNPGSVRFDDSALNLTLSGVVYQSDQVTPIAGGTCDDTTPVVRVMVNGVLSTTVPCSSADGSYSASGVTVVGDPTITVFLSGASGGEKASVITRTPTTNITNLHLYANYVILRNEDASPLTIANVAVYDNSNDADLQFTATTTGNPDILTVKENNSLLVFASSTFTPGGEVTLNGNANANDYDGTLYLEGDATFNAFSSSTLTIAGRLVLEAGATFDAASTTALFTATTTGKSITSPAEITFEDLTFSGAGGGWNVGADIVVTQDMSIASGTVTGTGNITVENGSLTGDGVLSMGAGTTTMERTNSLGGSSAWTFYDLVLGNGTVVGTTTPLFTSTTTISGQLVIENAHFLDAGNTKWDLAGSGTVFTETGTFLEDTSTIRYSGIGADVLDAQYYNLDINAGAGTPTYTAINAGLIVSNNLTIGGDAPTIFDLTANDPSLDVEGDVIIRSNGTLSASDSNTLTIAGSYDNNGTFTSNNGTTTFDGSGTITISAGSSDFGSVDINGSGDFTIDEHATATRAFVLNGATTFSVSSGETLAVGTYFRNKLGDTVNTWTGSTLRFYGGGDYEINPKTVSDSYGTLAVAAGTQIRMWNSDAATYAVDTTGSLYSMDHADTAGDLYIFGAYSKSDADDYWDYAYDFDGTALGGGSRIANVYIATSSGVQITGGSLHIKGAAGASTTIESTATDNYSFEIGGTASTSMQYYVFRDMDATGVLFSGTPDIETLSRGEFELAVTGTSAVKVAGSVITNNPAKTFNYNQFTLGAAANGFNVEVLGSALSAWRFFAHSGDIDGEDFDVDSGDPGEILWDNSTSTIDISGRVYQDEGTTVSAACGGGNNIHLYVNGSLENTASCDGTTGFYTFSDVSYSAGESVVVYINDETENAVTVSTDLVSSVSNFDLYEDRLIVRHESTDPIEIVDLDDWDLDNDPADIFFDAEPGTLTLNSDTKLIVWDSKEFQPGGNITTGGGAGDALDGTVELQDDATLTLGNGESHSFGGNLEMGIGADLVPAQSTVTFTSSGSGRTIDTNEDGFYNLIINGTGSFTSSDTVLTIGSDLTLTSGALTLPAATTTISGSLATTLGSFEANGGIVVFDSSGVETIVASSSEFADLRFAGSGTFTMSDTNATATESVIIAGGGVTLPSGTLVVGGDFRNIGGSVTHNTSDIILTNPTAGLLLASSSDLYSVTLASTGAYVMEDETITLAGSLTITDGSFEMASNTLSIGGSFLATGGTFIYPNPNATNTILFNSGDTGEVINPGTSDFETIKIAAPSGGYTVTGDATTTDNFLLTSVSDFTVQSGVVFYIGASFINSVGGSATTWDGSTLVLDGANQYSVNTKSTGGDEYETLVIGAASDLDMWNSTATTTTVDSSSSLYSQDHAAVDGALNIYGDYHISTTTEYWSYATDFDGTSASRQVTVSFAANATATVDGGALNIVGTAASTTDITNQGAGTYALAVNDGTVNAQYYSLSNMNADGLNLSGTPVISSLDYGSYTLAVNGGTLITLSSTTLNANASFVATGNDFSTTTAITGDNVTVTGSTASVWTFTGHTGNLDGEGYDVDGATACGQIRWDDSDCQITQQTHYRWRNDDGGLEIPDDEWMNASWTARKRVRIENDDNTTYTDAVVELLVAHDTDMQSDFADVRFTDSTGVTQIPFWIGSTTDNVSAEVWVKVSTLPANDTATVFMYYNNPSALSSSSASSTFTAADDFDDGSLSEYDGAGSGIGDDKNLFSVDAAYARSGGYGLSNTGQKESEANDGGMARYDQTIEPGQTIRYWQSVDITADGASDEVCTLFAVQSPVDNNENYAVCVERDGTDRIELVRDAVKDDASGVEMGSVPVDYTTGTTDWHMIEVDWGTDDLISLAIYNDGGTLLATTSSSSSFYNTGGGFGFTYWFNDGGWDNFTVRPTLTTEPTVRFGVEQTNGGATWAAAQDVLAGDFSPGEVARLRIAVENSGSAITNQQFRLDYAEQGSAPSCEAVDSSEYGAVPVQASCGTSPVCMQTSSNVVNGAAAVDLLTGTEGNYVSGEAREDPSNTTGNLDVAQNEYIELEYVVTPTASVVDPNLCFRVTDTGAAYDAYLKVAKMNVRFDPSFGNISFNGGQPITLLGGTTTRVYATSTVTDLNGYADIISATSTMYTTTAGAACTEDNNDCYISTTTSQCSFTNCSGNSCVLECYADVFFHADPTDNDGGLEWFVFLEAQDTQGGIGFNTSPGIELITLRSIDVDQTIDYGALTANSDTGAINPTSTVLNIGNVAVDVQIEGTDLSDGQASVIPAGQQKFATSSFTYGACVICGSVPTTSPPTLEVDLNKPTSETPPVADDVYWGIAIPIGTNSSVHQGMNIFTPVSD